MKDTYLNKQGTDHLIKRLFEIFARKKDVSTAYLYKGSVQRYSMLPQDAEIGWVYNIEEADESHGISAGDNVAWNGTEWDNLHGFIDLSDYATLENLGSVSSELSQQISRLSIKANDLYTELKQIISELDGKTDEEIESLIGMVEELKAEYEKELLALETKHNNDIRELTLLVSDDIAPKLEEHITEAEAKYVLKTDIVSEHDIDSFLGV